MTDSTATDEQLLEKCREGDTASFALLWQRHRAASLAAARGIAPTLDADDLVSTAYLKIFELVNAGKGPQGAFRPYLYKVISTVAADTYRSPEFAADDLDQVPDLHEAGPWQEHSFDLNAASRAFKTLPERWQQVLWYTEVEGLAPRQIGVMLGMSANSVSALAVRAREGLQSAWVEAHVDMQLADERCRSTVEHLQRFQRGKLTAKLSRDVSAHLDDCDQCSAAATEFSALNTQLALVLATIVVGAGAAVKLLNGLGALSNVATSSAAPASASASASAVTTTPGAPLTSYSPVLSRPVGPATTPVAATNTHTLLTLAASTLVVVAVGGAVWLTSALTGSALSDSLTDTPQQSANFFEAVTDRSNQEHNEVSEDQPGELPQNESFTEAGHASTATVPSTNAEISAETDTGASSGLTPDPTPAPSPVPAPTPFPSPSPSPAPSVPEEPTGTWTCWVPGVEFSSTYSSPSGTLPDGTTYVLWPNEGSSTPTVVYCAYR